MLNRTYEHSYAVHAFRFDALRAIAQPGRGQCPGWNKPRRLRWSVEKIRRSERIGCLRKMESECGRSQSAHDLSRAIWPQRKQRFWERALRLARQRLQCL